MDKSREVAKYDFGKLLKWASGGVAYAVGGYFTGLASLPFGAAPLGIALLSATDKNAIFVYLGLVLSCALGFERREGLVRLGIYTLILLLRALVRLTLDMPFDGKQKKYPLGELLSSLFSERRGYRYMIAALGAFALGCCYLAEGGLLYYDLFGLLLSVAIAPVSAYIFSLYFCKGGIVRDIGLGAICIAAVYGAAPLKVYGVSLAVLGGIFTTFLITEKRGTVTGALTGLGMGLAYSPVLAPIFPAVALCSGVFMKISPSLAAFSAFFASVAWGYYIKGIYILDGLFAGALSACLLYTVFRRLFLVKSIQKERAAPKCVLLPAGELDSIRLYDMNRRMSEIARGFERLTELCRQMSARFPSESELLKICSDAFDSSCADCPGLCRCRRNADISGESRRLAGLLRSDRGLRREDIDPAISECCTRLPDILDEINYNSGVRLTEGKTIYVGDFGSASRILQRAMESESGEYKICDGLSQSVCEALEGDGIWGAMVYGEQRKKIYIKGERNILQSERARILDAVGRALSYEIDTHRVEMRRCQGEGAALLVGERERIRVSYARRQMRARGESRFCGDSLRVFTNKDNRFYALISDGMGSGREAAETSEICAGFVEGMLTSGRMNPEILSSLNGFLCARQGAECSATVDMLELDLISGEATFFKSGAAATYVYREGSLFKLRSGTMPIGILSEVEIKSFGFELSVGDVVVMMSDGVTGGREECPWLFDLLRQNLEGSGLERTADLIMKYAVGNGSEDDITLALIRIEQE